MRKPELSTLPLALLGLIHQKPRSGYDLRKIFSFSPMGHFSNSTGAIYPALRRLKRDGLIEGKAAEGKTLRPREVFRLTACGEDRVRSELTLPVQREDVIRHMDRLMLRLAFMDEFLEKQEILEFMRGFLIQVEGYRQSLEDFRAHGPALQLTGRYAFDAGLEDYRTRESIARRMIRDLETGLEDGRKKNPPIGVGEKD